MAEHDRRQCGIRRRIRATDLGDRLVKLICCQESDLVGCPPMPDPGSRPVVAIKTDGPQPPARLSVWNPVIGDHDCLISKAIAFLWIVLPRQLDRVAIIVLFNGCACFFVQEYLLRRIIALLSFKRNPGGMLLLKEGRWP